VTGRTTRGGADPAAPVLRSVPGAPAPAGLQLDLLSAVVRLQQIRACLNTNSDNRIAFAEWLLEHRVLTCDLPRLAGYLTADTRDWAAVQADEFGLPGLD
jgi:hypothetical protein